MQKELIILGTGMYGNTVKETARMTRAYNRIVFFDDNFDRIIARFGNYIKSKSSFHVFPAIEDNRLRSYWLNAIEREKFLIPVIVHPTAKISPSAKIYKGSYIGENAVINADVVIGRGCIAGANAVIEQDSYIGDYSHIGMGSVIKSCSYVSGMYKVEAGTTFSNYYSYSFEMGM